MKTKSGDVVDIRTGDCKHVLESFEQGFFDLIYMDPPFFTRKVHELTTRDLAKTFSFSDLWESSEQYVNFLRERLFAVRRVLADSGSLFLHCDRNSSHLARLVLDEIFGPDNFRSEIIWTYRRWSNSDRKLLPAHQTILYYSKSAHFKFNMIREAYSPATNVDQILQRRARTENGKSAYERDSSGEVVIGGAKQGVPLSDVWDIPFLNPKARERTGYPTQKPVLLLDRIIRLASDPGDKVLDPFCGSGTTLVAARELDRAAYGIDISPEATALTRSRVTAGAVTRSAVLESGRDAFRKADDASTALLASLDTVPVQRNRGIDAFLNSNVVDAPVPIRVQRSGESLVDAAAALVTAAEGKGAPFMVLVQTGPVGTFSFASALPENVIVVESTAYALEKRLPELLKLQMNRLGA
ncbi:MAG TPA: site-specific DNA-methyltransferase [Thermoanaerobaculia bacterium]|jgi:site-specific DNA-methyltransferase (adenine-specific)